MSNPGMRLTAAGLDLLSRGMDGAEIKFSHIALGSGDFNYDLESVRDLTALRHYEMSLPIVEKKAGGGVLTLVGLLTNIEVEHGFPAKEHGIIAIDPDTGDEILYAYRNSGDEYSFIPAMSGPVKEDIRLVYECEIQDAPNVTVIIDDTKNYVGAEVYEEHVASAHPHPNIPNHFDNVTSTSKIWVTDEDNHLHQISVSNAQNVLLADADKKIAQNTSDLTELKTFINARDELGLNANLLIVEDFNPTTTLDELKIKVTSCAEGGNLIGVESYDGLIPGYTYQITDGVNCEEIQIASAAYNVSGFYVRAKNELQYPYDLTSTYLYRTTGEISDGKIVGTAEKKFIEYEGSNTFTGVQANIARTITFNTDLDNARAFTITGDGLLTDNGFFTLSA